MPSRMSSTRGYFTSLVILVVVFILITARLNRANPLPQQIVITEFLVQPGMDERVELYLVNMNEYNLELCFVETDNGTWQFLPGLDYPDTGFVILSDSSVVGDLELNDSGGYIRIFDEYFEWAIVYYGNHPESVVPAPGISQSASAELRIDEYEWITVDYYYLDESPTFGEWNDREGIWGMVRGTVTDSSTGLSIEGAMVMPSDSLHSVVTNSDGFFELDVVSGFPTVGVTVAGYRPYVSDYREITLLPDSTVTQNVELAVGSGIETSGSEGQSTPRSFALDQNHPNPFNPTTSIDYRIPERSRVTIEIYDMRGRLVRTLVDAVRDAGRYTVQWDGRDQGGRRISTGIYIYRLKTDQGFQFLKKMVVLK